MENKGMNRQSPLLKAFLKWIGLFIVVVAAIVIYFVIANADEIVAAIGSYIGILRPVVYGCVIAYILNPLMNTFQD